MAAAAQQESDWGWLWLGIGALVVGGWLGVGPCAKDEEPTPTYRPLVVPSYTPAYTRAPTVYQPSAYSPYVGDLDCSDFWGRVYDPVTNAQHGLDRDGDGVGCE